MVLVFDLDDTLYDEIRYVESGFRAVAQFVEREFGVSQSASYRRMLATLNKEGRGAVFNRLLESIGKFNRKNVRKCLSIYRLHHPEIELHRPGRDCLERFEDVTKFLVTDGNRETQIRKVRALGIEKHFRRLFITHRFGLDKAKPSPYCFNRISELTSVEPKKVIYVGDNPNKDFVGIRPLGFKTVRVLTGPFKTMHVSEKFDADLKIHSLDELTRDLVFKLVS